MKLSLSRERKLQILKNPPLSIVYFFILYITFLKKYSVQGSKKYGKL